MVAASYVTAASQSAGAAAEGTAARKCLKYAELSAAYEFQPVAVETSVRPSTPFSADTNTPIFLLSTDADTDAIPICFKSGRGAA